MVKNMNESPVVKYKYAKSYLETICNNPQNTSNYIREQNIAYYKYKEAAEEYIKELQFQLGNKVG